MTIANDSQNKILYMTIGECSISWLTLWKGWFSFRFMSLARKGLRCLKDLYVDGSFTSFNQLLANFGLNNSDFIRYFQLRDFVRTHSPTFPQIPPTTGTDHILLADTSTKGFVSYLYDHLLPTKESIIEKIWVDWENKLQITLSDQFEGKL